MNQPVQASSRAGEMRITFRLVACLQHRQVAIDLVSTIARHVPTADSMFNHELVTAFGEAFNNIVMHGYRDRDDGLIEVEADLKNDELTLTVMDSGMPFDFNGVSVPDLESMPESGMGVFMIHALVDEVVYRSGAPNVLSLRKRTTTKAAITQ